MTKDIFLPANSLSNNVVAIREREAHWPDYIKKELWCLPTHLI